MTNESSEAGSAVEVRPMLFKKKSKARSSAGGSLTPRSSFLKSEDAQTDGGDAEANGEEDGVQRTAGIGIRGKGSSNKVERKARGSSSALSFNEETASEPAFELKKSALAQAAKQRHAMSNLPDSLDQASIGESSNGYSASALAALKASTPRRGGMEGDGELDSAHQEMMDPSAQYDEEGQSLARLKFGADFADQGIPSEAIVAAAKERRRKAAVGDMEETSDFISLRDTRGPHPNSRLQREEDEQGSGEEDFAQYTGATERVALGQKAVKQARLRERNERQEAMDLDGSDDSGQEWERAQMDRIDMTMSRKQKDRREKSPFRPAPIPLTAPLPTLTSSSTRLATRVAALESSIKNHGQVIDDAVRQLKEMEGDEKRNKENILVAGEKEAWFREFDNFIISLANFLDEKIPRLEEIELDWKEILIERTRMVERKRANTIADEVCLFHGVPASNLLPKIASDKDQKDEMMPIGDGEALSSIREARRNDPSLLDQLNPADQAAFLAAQRDIQRRSRQVLDDVKASEFLDPAIRIDGKLHPSSLVSRFHQWRKIYPIEYTNAWGGLTLAGIWDFWIRREVCGWDFIKNGGSSLESFTWRKELMKYSAASLKSSEIGDEVNGSALEGALGGDDETISHAFTNTIIPRIHNLIEEGGVDVWSSIDVQSIISLMEQLSYVLERDNTRFQSLASVLILQFQKHILAVIDAISAPSVSPPPPFDPRTPTSLLSFLEKLKVLLFNLISLNRYVPSNERPFYVDLIDRLVGKVVWNLLVMAKQTGASQNVANDILARCSRGNLLKEELRSRLSAMASG